MTPERSITAQADEPLVAVVVEEGDQEIVRYFVEDRPDATCEDEVMRAALAAIGSCADLDWERWADELDRIRHASPPTPPIEL
jgi:hypothetical protein